MGAPKIRTLEQEREHLALCLVRAQDRIEQLEDDLRKRQIWLDKAKADAGFHRNESFDNVWNKVLAESRRYQYLRDCVPFDMARELWNPISSQTFDITLSGWMTRNPYARRTRDEVMTCA